MELSAPVRIAVRAVVAVVAATLVVSCSDRDSSPSIVVGAGNSVQSELIAQIYAGALARTGVHTAVKTGLGQRGDLLAALDADTVTVIGDDSGDLLTALDSGSPARIPDKPAADALAADKSDEPPTVAAALSSALPEGLAISDLADSTDLRPSFVLAHEAHQVAALRDLAPRCGELTVGIATGSELDPLRRSPDPQRDVLDPLRTVYGCDITRYTVYPGDADLRKALQDGQVQAGVFTAPAALLPGGDGDLATVADSAYAFRAHSIVPLFRKGTLTDTQIKKLNYVAGELTTADFTDMVRDVRDNHTPAPDLARTWLDNHSL
ncbi:glycine betaine ABC transporter substrate-binding protein [Nocardia transvalensis]|uniref:glycine betaine ABC transporter substrate-binding protein n=1 Tax=Nocardia transvalensis TaxID=37333 RepID=UPI001895E286|nr:glycine betaine ABC transporter substrate-binding protein [Nocardia transvalensis]MBF6327277.1 transporter [Nocardia transvalensis]